MSVITDENALAGESDNTRYLITGAGNTAIQGFARSISVNAGSTIQFAVHGPTTAIDIYRVGHYGGLYWRKLTQIANTSTTQGAGTTIPNSNGATTMASWSTTASWAIPADTASGLFIGVCLTSSNNPASWIPFVVRNDARVADIVVGIPTSTWALAYNYYHSPSNVLNGKNVYGSGGGGWDIENRGLAVSYDRPVVTRQHIVNHWDNYDSAMIDWLEQNGYDVKYVASEDLHFRPEVWNTSSLYMSVGHDEYWSQEMRDNVEAFRDAGGNCMFISGNEVFWKTRYTDERTMWCYKDTMPGPTGTGHISGVPFDPVTWTGTWRDSRRPGGAEPESLLTGTFFRMNGINFKSPVISAALYGGNPFWRGTSVQTTNLTLTSAVGFEADEIDIFDGRAYSVLAAAVINVNGSYANADGSDYSGNGSMDPWGIVMHQRFAGEGVVVGFGTMAWAWMLSNQHRATGLHRSTPCEQAMVNLLKDLAVSPDSLRSGLVNPAPVSLAAYGMVPPEPPDPPAPDVLVPWVLHGFGAAPVTPYLMAGEDLVELFPQGGPLAG